MEEMSRDELMRENEELRERLREAEDVLRAIREGKVDALAISDPEGDKIYTLAGADRAYRVFIDTMSEGAVTLSPDGIILYGNMRFEAMIGLSLTKIVGRSFFDFIAEEERESFFAILGKAWQESTWGETALLIEGKIIPVKLSISALELDEKDGFCVVVSDLTEEKRVQNKLKAYTSKLEVMNRELQEFIYIATHDLQEPLRKIQTFCSRIKDTLAGHLPENKVGDSLERIQKSARRMQDLLRALLSYSHVFRKTGSFETIDLNDLVLKAQTELKGPIRDAGAKIEFSALPSVEGESGQILRLFKNLMENSLKFRRDEPLLVRIYSEIREETVRVFIEDNGMGLDEKHISRIFKPFQQLHRRGVFGGTGIGLAVCRKIVEQHGGNITAESTPGAGSKFIVTLPLRQSRDETRAEGDSDGERTMEKLLSEVFKLKGQLQETEEFISAIREGKIDALVSYEPEGERVYTLKSADRGYRLLVESINEGAVILSSDGSIYYANPRFEEMLKSKTQKFARSRMIEHVHRDDREKFEVLLREAGEGNAAKGEVRLKAENGTLLPVYVSFSLLELEDFHGLCVILTDLTEQKIYIERLERSNRELQEFAAVAAHDLKEPLRKILTFGERFEMKYADALTAEGRDYIERMQTSAKRMQAFIQELLNFSQVATRAVRFKAVDLNNVLGEVVSDLQVRIEETGGTVQIGDVPSLEADPGQMRQLFLNLISNGLKFHGGKKPCVKVHGRIMREGEGESSVIVNGHCRIFVEDNGIGFDETHSERIFSPFLRLHSRREYEGTGLGLTICKKIIERHGGSITARSTLGKGATFIIELPLKQLRLEVRDKNTHPFQYK